MKPIPEQVAQWAREAGAAKFYPAAEADPKREDNYLVTQGFLQRFATLVAAWQAEQDALLCDENAQRSVRQLGSGAWAPAPADSYAAAIRANAPKVTT